MIVVTTPTGNIGSKVVEELVNVHEAVRIVARNPSHLSAPVRDQVEMVEGSHGDAAVINKALEGATALFWLVPPNPHAESMEAGYVDFTRPAAEAIRRHGVSRVVDVKALARGTRWQESAGLATVSEHMSKLLGSSGASLRSLAMPSFMDNVLMQIVPLRANGVLSGPIDAGRTMPRVATRDIAAVAARLLADRSWSGQADVPVLGPEDLSFDDMAEIMSDVLGREIRYQQVSFDAFADQMRSRGMPADFVQGYVDMMRAKDEGLDNAIERTAGAAAPTTFRQWCEHELKPAMHE